MTQPHPDRSPVYACLAYLFVAIVFAWPLPAHLGTHLTGTPAGDTGVYVWNQWVFQEELVHHRHQPYFTDRILSVGDRPANLALHNYTTFQNLLALPLAGLLGVVSAFNVVYLLMSALTAWVTFLLARKVTGRPAESWLAGALFAWSPVLVTRGAGHFSLVAAAPIAAFLILLLRAAERRRSVDAVALGVCVWWAASTDVYYAVYCLMILGVYLGAHTIAVEARGGANRREPWALDALVCATAGLVLAMVVTGGWEFTIFGQTVGMRAIYTPVLVLTALVLLRASWTYRVVVSRVNPRDALRVLRLAITGALAAAVLLSPVLFALVERFRHGGLDRVRTFWRSSAPGVDLLSLAVPNPNHPLAPDVLRTWLSGRPDGYIEAVASLSVVAIVVIAGARRVGWTPAKPWLALTGVFGALALGSFVHIGGVNTAIPGPWALLRYLPVVGLARVPGRFSIVMMLGLTILFATALCTLTERWPTRRRAILAVVTVLLLFELLPAPRPLYSAAVPQFYATIAAAPEPTRVLELPFGIRDGTASWGNFSPQSQFFQTVHGKAIFGGYLSRVSKAHVDAVRSDEMLAALITLSEGGRLPPAEAQHLIATGPQFVARSTIGFVVIDRRRASEALIAFATHALGLRWIDGDGPLDLYRPDPAPPEAAP